MVSTLLLNSTYECISFIPERKVFKLLAKGKIEVLSAWDIKVQCGCDAIYGNPKFILHPAVVRLTHHVRWIPRKIRYNSSGVFRRDQFACQYCAKALTPARLTIDHVIPRSCGGDTSWKNCVTACFECNNKKGDRTPEQASMPLIRRPFVPTLSIASEYHLMKNRHESWLDYIPNLNR